MNKKNLIKMASNQTGMSVEDVTIVLESLLNVSAFGLRSDGEVSVRGFGKIFIKDEKPKMARDIRKNLTIQLPARKTIKFKPFNDLKNCVTE